MFHFRMQTVLDARKALEEKVTFEFSELKKKLQDEMACLEMIQQQKAGLVDALRNIKGQKIAVADIVIIANEIRKSQENEHIQKKAVQTLHKDLDEKRQELLKATKEKKVMEICKEQHFEKYSSEERTLERMALDELVMVGHNRRKQT